MNRLREWTSPRWLSIRRKSRLAFEVIDRSVRYFLLASGVPLKREFLVLRCAGGRDASGLFSEFAAVLGSLEHYEKWKKIYAGLRVDFADQGLYFDPTIGYNWWEYYFEPVHLGRRADAVTRIISESRHDALAYGVTRMPRERGHALIDRYIRPKPHIREKVDAYVRANFSDAYVIGVHYRGTDKQEIAPRVRYGEIRSAIQRAAESMASGRYKVFVATDEQPFLDYMFAVFPNSLIYRRMYRSVDGAPTHRRNIDNHVKGEDAVMDCLLLARCHYLIRTASNLSFCSILFNPNVLEIALNREE